MNNQTARKFDILLSAMARGEKPSAKKKPSTPIPRTKVDNPDFMVYEIIKVAELRLDQVGSAPHFQNQFLAWPS